MRLLTYPIPTNHGQRFKAEAKGNGVRIYLGTFDSPAQAQANFDEYMLTGAKPPASKRGPRGAQTNPREITRSAPNPAPNLDRLELIRRIACRLQ